jgi:nicotinamidase-related amidase
MVIDVQNEYFTGRLPVSRPAGSLENILTVMDRAHDSCLPVIDIQHTSTDLEASTFRKGLRYGKSLTR